MVIRQYYIVILCSFYMVISILYLCSPGCVTSSSTIGGGAVTLVSTSQLILSGGEGYINFRIGELRISRGCH